MARGVSIRVFLADGDPNGLRIVEKSNWTGVVLIASRADVATLRERAETHGPGVYLLVGPGVGDVPDVYVGEADDVAQRLTGHVRAALDFWTHVVVITTKDANFNKAFARWIEARLIRRAQEAGRAHLQNGNAGAPVRLSEADEADMEAFLEDVLMLLPVLGVSAFDVPTVPEETSHRVRLYLRSRGCDAQGFEDPQGFLVLAGAVGRADATASLHEYVQTRRQALIDSGAFVAEGRALRLTRDTVFASPSTAAAVVLGRAANGRTEWKDAAGVTLKARQEAAGAG